jgi:Uma2 family endonuclease
MREQIMALQQRLYDVDDLWQFLSQLENDGNVYELIDGVIIEMPRPGGQQGRLAIRLGRFLDIYAEENALGIVTGETGYHSRDNRYALLGPDVAFISAERAPQPFPETFVPLMPDLAVEIASPTDTQEALRRKALRYLRNGTKLVWMVWPARRSVEVCRLQAGEDMSLETLLIGDTLSGADLLPGFELALTRLFA